MAASTLEISSLMDVTFVSILFKSKEIIPDCLEQQWPEVGINDTGQCNTGEHLAVQM